MLLLLSSWLLVAVADADPASSPVSEPTYDVSSNFMTKGERHSPSYTLQKSQVECLYAPFHSGNSATISVFVPSVSHAKAELTAAAVFEGPIATLVDTSPRHARGELGNALMEGMRGHWPAVQAVEAKRGGSYEGSSEKGKLIKFDEVVDFEHVRDDADDIDDEEGGDDDDDEVGEIRNPRERRKRKRRERRASGAWGRRKKERKKKRGNNNSRKRSQGRSQKKERERGNGSRWTGALPNQKFNVAKERARALTDAQSRYEGEPCEQTFTMPIDGWYRFCVRPTPLLPSNAALTVEMDLRSSSELGGIDDETGHVYTHQRRLEMTEDAELMLMLSDEAQVEGIKDEDLFTTTRLIKSLTDMVHEIREAQQQHKHRLDHHRTLEGHSHAKLVWSAKVETMLYVGITAFQVYTVRNWFKRGQLLGR